MTFLFRGLAELMQWLPADEVAGLALKEPLATRLGEENSDVLLYLVCLADVAGVDLPKAVERMMQSSEERFSPQGFRGNASVKS